MMPRWLLWTLVALVSWGVWAVVSKLIGDALSAAQSQALSTLGLLPTIAALAFARKPSGSRTPRRGILCGFAAGVLACLGNVAYYHALSLGGKASTVTPLTALYLFNAPAEAGVLSGWLRYGLIPIGMWGVSGLLQKISTNYVSGETATFWFLAAFVPVGAVILLTQPWPARVTSRTWLLVIAVGLFFSVGNYAILVAFAGAGKASVITPLTGLYPVVSVPLAILFHGETIGAREVAALVMALVSVVALSHETPPASNAATI